MMLMLFTLAKLLHNKYIILATLLQWQKLTTKYR